jgi:succinate dehydrogenase flavin-adding protein (antitoxin of CptAB toxin-antitoxin module)
MTNKNDIDECIAILESSDWDLMTAVNAAIEPEHVDDV